MADRHRSRGFNLLRIFIYIYPFLFFVLSLFPLIRVQHTTLWINHRTPIIVEQRRDANFRDDVDGGGTIDKIRVGNNYRVGQDQLIKIAERFRSVSIRQSRRQYITRHESRSSPRSSPIRSIRFREILVPIN